MVDDDVLASLVATDLRRNLEARAPGVRDVYGFCLWTDDVNGDFLASIATEDEFRRQRNVPAYASTPDDTLSGPPDGLQWNVGNWHQFPDDDFLADDTKAALEPLVARLTDDNLDDAALHAESERWREIAFAALDLVQPLNLLPCTDYAIAFVDCADTTAEEKLRLMSRTVPANRLQELFPGWCPRPND